MADPRNNETPTLYEVIRNTIEQRLTDLHTAMPGKVSSYDSASGLATIEPQLKRKYIGDEDPITLPLIVNVPVMHPRTSKAHIRLPVSVGDQGMIFWSERSMDLWLEQGRAVDPEDDRKFSLSDAVFHPGPFAKNSPMSIKGSSTSLEMTNDKAFIDIGANGNIKIENPKVTVEFKADGNISVKNGIVEETITPEGDVTITNGVATFEIKKDGKYRVANNTEELLQILSETLTALNVATTNTIFGPLQLNNFATYLALKIRLDTLKG
jgi:hypothetical protein